MAANQQVSTVEPDRGVLDYVPSKGNGGGLHEVEWRVILCQLPFEQNGICKVFRTQTQDQNRH